MKTNNEIPIPRFRLDIDLFRSEFLQSLVIEIVFTVLLLLLVILAIGFAVTRSDCQSLELSFPISIMAICVFEFILHQYNRSSFACNRNSHNPRTLIQSISISLEEKREREN